MLGDAGQVEHVLVKFAIRASTWPHLNKLSVVYLFGENCLSNSAKYVSC